MSPNIRQISNTLDSLFDGRAIVEESHSVREGGEPHRQKTARQAFELVQPMARELDEQAQLKMIVSQHGLNPDGTSAHWEFFFDLIQRRAQMTCEWALSWDEENDDYGAASVEVRVRPFPPAGSPLRKMVKEGTLLHPQLVKMWKEECARRPELPIPFRDTDLAVADLIQQGLDPAVMEFSLHADVSPKGRPTWLAQTRDKTFYCPFT